MVRSATIATPELHEEERSDERYWSLPRRFTPRFPSLLPFARSPPFCHHCYVRINQFLNNHPIKISHVIQIVLITVNPLPWYGRQGRQGFPLLGGEGRENGFCVGTWLEKGWEELCYGARGGWTFPFWHDVVCVVSWVRLSYRTSLQEKYKQERWGGCNPALYEYIWCLSRLSRVVNNICYGLQLESVRVLVVCCNRHPNQNKYIFLDFWQVDLPHS